VVDAARAGSILVVVLWHWALSVTHRSPEGDLVMPNPVHAVPGGWLATWVLQVVPVFFLVGGYANLAAWRSARRNGRTVRAFLTRRMRRLLLPFALWVCCWVVVELVVLTLAAPRGHDFVWQWFPGLLAPLWFLGVYAVLTALTPATAELHLRHGGATVTVVVALIVVGSVVDRVTGTPGVEWLVAGLVWVFCHQLGYVWRSTDLGRRPLPVRAGVALAGVAGLATLTTVGGYPRSMVAEVGAASNMLPTTAPIAALAVCQLGLLAVVTPAAQRVLEVRAVWVPVAVVNLVAVSILVWHMTAYTVSVLAFEALGGRLIAEPTASWWADRWLWVLAPAVVLALFLVVVTPVENASRGHGPPAAGRT
jgi:peptidoglycan/LPS O-acetylase OafA/YrhL